MTTQPEAGTRPGTAVGVSAAPAANAADGGTRPDPSTSASFATAADDTVRSAWPDSSTPASPESADGGALVVLALARAGLVGLAKDRAGVVAQAGSERLDEVIASVDEMIGALTSLKLEALRAKETSQSWRADGSATFEAWRAKTSGQGTGAAHRDARISRDLAELPVAANALASGEITPEHAAVISRFRHQGHTDLRDKALASGGEERLVNLARRQDAAAFARSAARLGHLFDAEALADDHTRTRQRRYLRLAKRHGGLHGEFFLDSAAGQELRIALEAQTEAPAKDDERTSEQRAADALSGLATTALDSGTLKTGALVKPHLSLIMTQETLAQARALRRRSTRHRAGTPDGRDGARDGAPEGSVGPNARLGDPWLEDLVTATPSLPLEPDTTPPRPTTGASITEPAPTAATQAGSCSATDTTQAGTGLATDATQAGTGAASDDEPEADSVPLSKAQQARAEMLERINNGLAALPLPAEPAMPARLTLTSEELTELLADSRIPAAEFDDGTLVPPQVLARVLCDCLIGRIAIDAEGQPTDLGQEERTATRELRRAILVRDRTCRWPGCSRPARWCDYHHLVFWSRGGHTSIINGIHLCRHHHETGIHDRGAIIVAVPGGFDFHWPDGTYIGHTDHATRPYAHRRNKHHLPKPAKPRHQRSRRRRAPAAP